MNQKTEPSSSKVEKETADHVRISFTTANQKWQGVYDFYPERCDFTMLKISSGYKYWIQYEGTPGGEMDSTDFWVASGNSKRHPIREHFVGDLPNPEWIAFGDITAPRVLYMLHHQNDTFPDNYVDRADMTVFAFGRENKDKFLTTEQRFSIGFIESTDYEQIAQSIKQILKKS